MLTAYPEGVAELIDEAAESEMQAIIELISRVRNIRSEMNIKPGERITIVVASPDENLRRVFNRPANRSRVWLALPKFQSAIVSMRRRLQRVRC